MVTVLTSMITYIINTLNSAVSYILGRKYISTVTVIVKDTNDQPINKASVNITGNLQY